MLRCSLVLFYNMNITDLEKVQNKIDEIIAEYYKYDVHSPAEVLTMARELAVNLFYLGQIKSDFNKMFQAKIYSLVNTQNYKVNAATNQAEYEFPQLYKVRHELNQGNKILEIMRSQVSLAKTELTNVEVTT